MPNDKDESGGIDFDVLADTLKKAGLVTKDQLAESVQNGFSKFLQANAGKGQMTEHDIMMHLEGKCESGANCDIAKMAQGLYQDAFIKGAFYGVKLGGFGAKKGVFL